MGLNKTKYIFFIFLFLSFAEIHAQTNHYIVFFTDKNLSDFSVSDPSQFLSPRAIARREKQNIAITEQDLPVNNWYLDSLTNEGATVVYALKWLNAAVIIADASTMTAINSISIVKSSSVSSRMRGNTNSNYSMEQCETIQYDPESFYGVSYPQLAMLGIDEMHSRGFTGKGMLVGVFDSGFTNVNIISEYQQLFNRGGVLATYDLVEGDLDVYNTGDHGSQVFSVMAAYNPGTFIGGIYEADFCLFRTENAVGESPVETLNWCKAAELADSIGVDVITTSLGYNTFDNTSLNFVYADMDGNTTTITQSADIAASKGILVLASVGNEGNNTWKYLLAPSDADSVVAVGSVEENLSPSGFSSHGPSYDGRIKPDLSARGGSVWVVNPAGAMSINGGTSFATPLMASLATGFWQAHPELTNMEVISLLKQSATHYDVPNHRVGYGIPEFFKADYLINWKEKNDEYILAPNPVSDEELFLYSDLLTRGQSLTFRLYDMMGQQLSEFTETATGVRIDLQVHTNSLAPGMYVLTLSDNVKTVKWRIEKK